MVAPFGQSTALPQGAADEVALVQGAQAGHQNAREELARRYRRPAYLLALQMVGDRDDALDIAQDAPLRFFESLGRFQSDRPIRPWLLTIVRNRVRDLWRQPRPFSSCSATDRHGGTHDDGRCRHRRADRPRHRGSRTESHLQGRPPGTRRGRADVRDRAVRPPWSERCGQEHADANHLHAARTDQGHGTGLRLRRLP